MTMTADHFSGAFRAASVLVVLLALPALGRAGTALAAQGEGTVREGPSGIHLLAGGFVGRFDLDDGGRTDLFGGRAGVGFGELLELAGFYWHGFDRSGDTPTAEYGWGGEIQLNLNAGFGLTPFVTGGIARVQQDGDAIQNAAVVGGGMAFPLGPVILHAAVRDYLFGVSGLETAASPETVTHNWLYSAGLKLALGSRRRGADVVAAQPARPTPAGADGAARATAAELAALRDSLRSAERALVMRGGLAGVDTLNGPRNYQSDRRIEIPLPTEGSITLRYGPETAAVTPLVVQAPATAADERAGGGAGAVRSTDRAGASLQDVQDPATRQWIQQLVAAQVADQLSRRPAAAPALTDAQAEAVAQRVLAAVMATVVPQLEASQARRLNALREDFRVALQAQRADLLSEAGRAATTPPAARVAAPAGEPERAAEVPAQAESADRPSSPGPTASADEARVEAEGARARVEAAARAALADVAAAHSRFLTAVQTHRGPAAVLGGAAFERGAVLVPEPARPAVAAVADALAAYPDRRIYIHGHTDAAGSELEDQRLSELRAETVRSLLVQAGLPSDRLFAVGYGHGRPVADNAIAAGRAQNRRVEIVLGERRSEAAR